MLPVASTGCWPRLSSDHLSASLPLQSQIAHSEGFLEALFLEAFEGSVLELGAGGGLPGLVLAVQAPDLRLVLLDSARRSVDFLSWAVEELGIAARVEIVTARAEEVGRDERYRGRFSAVVARSFGKPAVTAECAAPLLKVGGRLIVSEPPPTVAGVSRERRRRSSGRRPLAGRGSLAGGGLCGTGSQIRTRAAWRVRVRHPPTAATLPGPIPAAIGNSRETAALLLRRTDQPERDLT